ncbi:MAG: Asp-tRNA(Asn)/Glu-tRNA(Gln) amidotransferase subunit GatB [Patescibacteria group bacterium]|nr:Asp-tRNA(Asn)/Glu-tRNA(Gln) amidotransferase subunit GatB [Patescibacteria group bacterium]
MKFVPIIGLEIHVQLNTASKMFCACPNVDDGAPPNTAICPVCTGQPGALPALNSKALEKGILAGLALNCRIPEQSAFDRKNYFYPDLPKGYQISQFALPIALSGQMVIEVPENAIPKREQIKIGITRVHLEEDAAKNFHAPQGMNGRPATLVDYNRAGTPLIEIVTEPDLRSPSEAKFFLQELRAIMRAIKVSNADMEKGQMRCDVNISLLEIDDNGYPLKETLNARTEIKNLNSFRAVERAIAYEVQRQTAMYESGTPPVESTRGWDDNQGKTLEQRTKETSADYRYFPEPDLPPQDLIATREKLTSALPELPAAARRRLQDEWGFPAAAAAFFTLDEAWQDYAENVMSELGGWLESSDDKLKSGGEIMAARKSELAKLASGWLTSKLAGLLAERNLTISQVNITPENFAEFLKLLDSKVINSTNGQKLMQLMMDSGGDPSDLMETHNLGQNLKGDELSEIVKRNLEANPDKVADIKAGKIQIIKWFVGVVMRETEGRANPQQAEEEIRRQLEI